MAVNYAEKIANLDEAIAKKQALISKREKQIEKCTASLRPYVKKYDTTFKDVESVLRKLRNSSRTAESDFYEVSDLCDKISDAEESIRNAKEVIAEKMNTRKTYTERLAKEANKDLIIQQLPAPLKEFREKLFKEYVAWSIKMRPLVTEARKKHYADYHAISEARYKIDRSDKEALAKINKELKALDREYENKYGPYEYLIGMSDEDIKNREMETTRALILDLFERVTKITGEITDSRYLYVTRGNDGYAVINGTVVGTKGKARVESHGCAGYNIVRYYVRTNVYRMTQ